MYKKTMKKWGLGAITGVLVLGSLTPIIQPYMTVSAAENTIKQLKASDQGTISDVMFEDLNGNSVQDNNETTGVAGIKVELYNDQGTLVSTSTTGTDGRYTFSNVPDGTYYLHVDMSTLPSDEKLYTTQGINGADGNSSYFTIANGNTITGFHFGFYPQQGAIQSFVYNDTNKNGQKDSNESGISGVHIALYNESGTKVADATTDSSGAYSFTAVKPGKYYAKADIPSDYKYQSSTYFGADGTTGYFTVASEQTLHNELNLGLSTLNNSAVSGTVTDAATGNGLANTRVELHDVQGNLINAQQTDASGHYNFTGLAAGDYYTKVVIPSDYDFVSSNGFGSDGNSNYIQLNGENTSSNYTIALKKQVKDNSAVSGTVTDATTSNGLANIRVELHDVQGNLVDAKQTDASGRYNFTGLAAGNYYTKVVIPNNYDFASSNGFGSDGNSNYIQLNGENTSSNYTIALKKQANTTISGVINTPSGQGVSENVSLYNVDGTLVKTVATNSQGNFSFDGISEGNYYVKASIPEGYTFESSAGFGSDGNSYYLQADGTSNISNLRLTLAQKTGQIRSTVFSDLNKNGTQEAGESGIAGATVTLYSNTGAVVETTTTDANGLYKFETITPGTYYVKVTAPAGYDVLANTAFGDDGVSGYININAEQTRTDMNASLVAKADPTAVANAKWIYHTGFAPSTDLAEGGEISVSNTYKDGYNNDNVDVAFYNSEDKIVDPSSYTTTLSNPDLFSSVKANGTHIAFTHTEKTGSSLVTVKDASGKVVRTFTITITADPTAVADMKWTFNKDGSKPSISNNGTINITNAYKDINNYNNVNVQFYNQAGETLDTTGWTTTLSDPTLVSVKNTGSLLAFTHTEKTGSTLVTVKDASGKVVRTFTLNITQSNEVTDVKWNFNKDGISRPVNNDGVLEIPNTYMNQYNKPHVDLQFYNSTETLVQPTGYTVSFSDPSIATADLSDPNLIALVHNDKAGSTNVTIRDMDGNVVRSFTFKVTSTDVAATDLTLATSNITANVNDTGKIDATVAPSNATNKTLSYTPADPSIITVDANGNWTAKKAGTTTVAVKTTDGSNITKTVNVTVTDPNAVTSVKWNFNKDGVSRPVNNSGVLEIPNTYLNQYNKPNVDLQFYNSNATLVQPTGYTVSFSDPSIATADLSDPNLIALVHNDKAGSTNVTIRDAAGNIVRSFTYTVTATDILATDLTLATSNITANVNDTGKIDATVAPSNATNKALSYTPADSSIITVDANGNWTAKKAGTTTITVKTLDGSNISKTINVTVAKSMADRVGSADFEIVNQRPNTGSTGTNVYIYPHSADVPAGVVYTMETYNDTAGISLVRTDTLGTSDGTYHQMIHCTTPFATWGLQGHNIKVYATYQGTRYLILDDQSYKYYTVQTTHEWTD
ncbi:SdrD B-like domain-containing protein [Listeria booriae]|uniref:SdrD B-like domain-containing protein n=1 Tax=Listeria booriae TaxID=1552123 RepID=UPI00164E0BFC|nr:SdrD B-like domain-containing protein [Listeria booriae]MBC6298982.1 hypothetical protein [Listeria booriae]